MGWARATPMGLSGWLPEDLLGLKGGPFEDILAEGDRDRELWQALTSQHDAGFLEGPGWPSSP